MDFDQEWKGREFFFLLHLSERHHKPNKMKDEREDQKCSHTGNVGIQCSQSGNTWEEDLPMIKDDAGRRINQS